MSVTYSPCMRSNGLSAADAATFAAALDTALPTSLSALAVPYLGTGQVAYGLMSLRNSLPVTALPDRAAWYNYHLWLATAPATLAAGIESPVMTYAQDPYYTDYSHIIGYIVPRRTPLVPSLSMGSTLFNVSWNSIEGIPGDYNGGAYQDDADAALATLAAQSAVSSLTLTRGDALGVIEGLAAGEYMFSDFSDRGSYIEYSISEAVEALTATAGSWAIRYDGSDADIMSTLSAYTVTQINATAGYLIRNF